MRSDGEDRANKGLEPTARTPRLSPGVSNKDQGLGLPSHRKEPSCTSPNRSSLDTSMIFHLSRSTTSGREGGARSEHEDRI